MTKDHEEGTFCPNCFAGQVSTNVLFEFTEACPEVQMSYQNWMILETIIEQEIKKGLGVATEEPEADKVTVQ